MNFLLLLLGVIALATAAAIAMWGNPYGQLREAAVPFLLGFGITSVVVNGLILYAKP